MSIIIRVNKTQKEVCFYEKNGFNNFWGGLGGDELNAGEYEHFIYFFADLRKLGLEKRLQQEIKMWAEYHDHPIFKKIGGLLSPLHLLTCVKAFAYDNAKLKRELGWQPEPGLKKG